MTSTLTELIARAPWREAVTYRDTWPPRVHTVRQGRSAGVAGGSLRAIPRWRGRGCRFFRMNNTYLFIGDHKYWLMTHWDDLKPGEDYVLNRARLYRDRRDFVIQPGDTGKPEDYPANPADQS